MMLKYASAFVLLIAAGPVFAQSSTQNPPSMGSSASEPQSSNSLPPGAGNANLNSPANPNLAGSALGGTTTTTMPQPPASATRP